LHFEIADAFAPEGLHVFDEQVGAEGDVTEDRAEAEPGFFEKLVATFARLVAQYVDREAYAEQLLSARLEAFCRKWPWLADELLPR
jgi:hypothetical protein